MFLRSFRVGFALAVVTIAAQVAAEPDLPGTGADAGQTVIYRDTWGVPHIYAPTVEAGIYAQGWAQAEDRPHQLLKNMLRGLGEAASVDGPKIVPSDLVARIWDHYGTAKRQAHTIRPQVRTHLRALARGMREYYSAHPADVPEWWGDREIDEYMLMAFSRLYLYAWSSEQAFGDLRRAGIDPEFGHYHHGSNQWAVAPSRSAEGAATLYIDPHLPWFGAARWWEFRIHAGELHGSGVTLPGIPYIGLGHTEHLAWAMTTGGPDTTDVYELTLHATDPSRYLFDGEWRQLTKREFTLRVKGEPAREITSWYSHHGPIIAWKDGRAYAAKTAYADSVHVSDAFYEFNFGTDYRGAVAAMATGQILPQNVMSADTSGNIYYQRAGRVPRRPEGFDWSRPVNGSTSATEWRGLHPVEDHVQVLNPPQGYMQNCNIPPDAMMVNSPMTLERALTPYLYADRFYHPQRAGWTNQRGARAVELLSANDSVSREDLFSYANDVRTFGFERWLAALRLSDSKAGTPYRSDAEYAAGLTDLLAWDGEMHRDSTGALKYYYWRTQLIAEEGYEEMAARIDNLRAPLGHPTPKPVLTPEEMEGMVAALARAMAALESDHGSLDAPFGVRFRVGRGNLSWPVGGGGDPEIGMSTLRAVKYGPERGDHTQWGIHGQSSTQVVVLTRPPQSWSRLPIGQSDRPDSPHYRDQAERLFSPRQLKPTWWRPEELAGHIESRTVLPLAEAGSLPEPEP